MAADQIAKRPQQLIDILFLGFHAGVQPLDILIDPIVVRPVPFNGFFDTAHPLAPISNATPSHRGHTSWRRIVCILPGRSLQRDNLIEFLRNV